MHILSKILSLFSHKKYSRHELDQMGRNFVLSEIHHAIRTTYGIDHNFASIRTYQDFLDNVPLVEYDDLAPYIQRSLAGEQNILTAHTIDYFAKSA